MINVLGVVFCSFINMFYILCFLSYSFVYRIHVKFDIIPHYRPIHNVLLSSSWIEKARVWMCKEDTTNDALEMGGDDEEKGVIFSSR